MRRIHVFNPVAGKGHEPEMLTGNENLKDEYYITQGVGDARKFVCQACRTDPDTHFIVYGGDGTLNEAVCGVLDAGAGETALLSVVPIGTGNDFIRSLPEEKGTEIWVDAMKIGDDYGINISNMGFDCSVVDKTQKYKTLPLVTGSAAYVLGVADVLVHKLGEPWVIELVNEKGEEERFEQECLLTLVANGKYYGGGFKPAPLADLQDGLLDVLIVKKVSRAKFISLFGDYRKGTHLNPETGEPYDRFKEAVIYRRATSVHIAGLARFCSDGELGPKEEVTISVLPHAVRFRVI